MGRILGETMLTNCNNCKKDYDEYENVLCPHCDHSMDNILVRQKDYILNLINNRRYTEARCCLTILSELWIKHDYKYKYEELQKRIRECTVVHSKRLSNNGGDS